MGCWWGGGHCQETTYSGQGIVLEGMRSYQQKESFVVLRFLGTGEQSASIEKLTGLSIEVMLSLVGWFRSFGNRSGSSLRHHQLQEYR